MRCTLHVQFSHTDVEQAAFAAYRPTWDSCKHTKLTNLLLHTYQSGGIDRQYEGMSTVTLVIDDTLTQRPIGLELRGFEQLWRVRFLGGSPRKIIEPWCLFRDEYIGYIVCRPLLTGNLTSYRHSTSYRQRLLDIIRCKRPLLTIGYGKMISWRCSGKRDRLLVFVSRMLLTEILKYLWRSDGPTRVITGHRYPGM